MDESFLGICPGVQFDHECFACRRQQVTLVRPAAPSTDGGEVGANNLTFQKRVHSEHHVIKSSRQVDQ